jgi:hypothetical protein
MRPLNTSEKETTDLLNTEPRRIVLNDARHPCVELMDNVNFIANSYNLIEGESNFQIMTGPNMVSVMSIRLSCIFNKICINRAANQLISEELAVL